MWARKIFEELHDNLLSQCLQKDNSDDSLLDLLEVQLKEHQKELLTPIDVLKKEDIIEQYPTLSTLMYSQDDRAASAIITAAEEEYYRHRLYQSMCLKELARALHLSGSYTIGTTTKEVEKASQGNVRSVCLALNTLKPSKEAKTQGFVALCLNSIIRLIDILGEKKKQEAVVQKVPLYLLQSINNFFDALEFYVSKVNLSSCELETVLSCVPQSLTAASRSQLETSLSIINANSRGTLASPYFTSTSSDILDFDGLYPAVVGPSYTGRLLLIIANSLLPFSDCIRWSLTGDMGEIDASKLMNLSPTSLLRDSRGEWTELGVRIVRNEFWEVRTMEGEFLKATVRSICYGDSASQVRSLVEENFLANARELILLSPPSPQSASLLSVHVVRILLRTVAEPANWGELAKNPLILEHSQTRRGEREKERGPSYLSPVSPIAPISPSLPSSKFWQEYNLIALLLNAIIETIRILPSASNDFVPCFFAACDAIKLNAETFADLLPPQYLSVANTANTNVGGNLMGGTTYPSVPDYSSTFQSNFDDKKNRNLTGKYIKKNLVGACEPANLSHLHQQQLQQQMQFQQPMDFSTDTQRQRQLMGDIGEIGEAGEVGGDIYPSLSLSLSANVRHYETSSLTSHSSKTPIDRNVRANLSRVSKMISPSLSSLFSLASLLLSYLPSPIVDKIAFRFTTQNSHKPWLQLNATIPKLHSRLVSLLSPASQLLKETGGDATQETYPQFMGDTSSNFYAASRKSKNWRFYGNNQKSNVNNIIANYSAPLLSHLSHTDTYPHQETAIIYTFIASLRLLSSLFRPNLLTSLPPQPSLISPVSLQTIVPIFDEILSSNSVFNAASKNISPLLSQLISVSLESFAAVSLAPANANDLLLKLLHHWVDPICVRIIANERDPAAINLSISLLSTILSLSRIVGYRRRFSFDYHSFTSFVFAHILDKLLDPQYLSSPPTPSSPSSPSTPSHSQYWLLASLTLQYIKMIIMGPLPPTSNSGDSLEEAPFIDEIDATECLKISSVALSFSFLLDNSSQALHQILSLATLFGHGYSLLSQAEEVCSSAGSFVRSTVRNGIDIVRILLMRDAIVRVTAKKCYDELEKLYEQNNASGRYHAGEDNGSLMETLEDIGLADYTETALLRTISLPLSSPYSHFSPIYDANGRVDWQFVRNDRDNAQGQAQQKHQNLQKNATQPHVAVVAHQNPAREGREKRDKREKRHIETTFLSLIVEYTAIRRDPDVAKFSLYILHQIYMRAPSATVAAITASPSALAKLRTSILSYLSSPDNCELSMKNYFGYNSVLFPTIASVQERSMGEMLRTLLVGLPPVEILMDPFSCSSLFISQKETTVAGHFGSHPFFAGTHSSRLDSVSRLVSQSRKFDAHYLSGDGEMGDNSPCEQFATSSQLWGEAMQQTLLFEGSYGVVLNGSQNCLCCKAGRTGEAERGEIGEMGENNSRQEPTQQHTLSPPLLQHSSQQTPLSHLSSACNIAYSSLWLISHETGLMIHRRLDLLIGRGEMALMSANDQAMWNALCREGSMIQRDLRAFAVSSLSYLSPLPHQMYPNIDLHQILKQHPTCVIGVGPSRPDIISSKMLCLMILNSSDQFAKSLETVLGSGLRTETLALQGEVSHSPSSSLLPHLLSLSPASSAGATNPSQSAEDESHKILSILLKCMQSPPPIANSANPIPASYSTASCLEAVYSSSLSPLSPSGLVQVRSRKKSSVSSAAVSDTASTALTENDSNDSVDREKEEMQFRDAIRWYCDYHSDTVKQVSANNRGNETDGFLDAVSSPIPFAVIAERETFIQMLEIILSLLFCPVNSMATLHQIIFQVRNRFLNLMHFFDVSWNNISLPLLPSALNTFRLYLILVTGEISISSSPEAAIIRNNTNATGGANPLANTSIGTNDWQKWNITLTALQEHHQDFLEEVLMRGGDANETASDSPSLVNSMHQFLAFFECLANPCIGSRLVSSGWKNVFDTSLQCVLSPCLANASNRPNVASGNNLMLRNLVLPNVTSLMINLGAIGRSANIAEWHAASFNKILLTPEIRKDISENYFVEFAENFFKFSCDYTVNNSLAFMVREIGENMRTFADVLLCFAETSPSISHDVMFNSLCGFLETALPYLSSAVGEIESEYSQKLRTCEPLPCSSFTLTGSSLSSPHCYFPSIFLMEKKESERDVSSRATVRMRFLCQLIRSLTSSLSLHVSQILMACNSIELSSLSAISSYIAANLSSAAVSYDNLTDLLQSLLSLLYLTSKNDVRNLAAPDCEPLPSLSVSLLKEVSFNTRLQNFIPLLLAVASNKQTHIKNLHAPFHFINFSLWRI